MKIVVDTIKEVQSRRLLKRSFAPREEFMNNTRELFLAEVAKRRVAPYAPQLAWYMFGMRTLRYSIAFAVIALVGTSGLVAYADGTNVAVDSPLYSLKRVGEQDRLTVAPAAKEVEVYRELAERRANEFIQIETKKKPDNSDTLDALRKLEDTEKELRSAFRKNIEALNDYSDLRNTVPATVDFGLCQAAQLVDRRGDNGKSDQYKRFEDQCERLMGDNFNDNRDRSMRAGGDSRTTSPVDLIDDRGGENNNRVIDNPSARTSGRGDPIRQDDSKDRDRGGSRTNNHDEIREERD